MAFNRNGVRPSSFDARDYLFQPAAMGLRHENLPTSVELVVPFAPWNQGNGSSRDVPCCVSCSIVTAMEVLDAQKSPETRLSVLFHYYAARQRADRLTDLEMREGLRTAVNVGVCDLDLHLPASADAELTREDAKAKPAVDAYNDASQRRILGLDNATLRMRYHRIIDSRDPGPWKAAITAGFPIVLVFPITQGYLEIVPSGNDIHGPVTGRPINPSYHAVCAFGFDKQGGLHVRDSRDQLGTVGNWWLPWPVISQPTFISEAWVIEGVTY